MIITHRKPLDYVFDAIENFKMMNVFYTQNQCNMWTGTPLIWLFLADVNLYLTAEQRNKFSSNVIAVGIEIKSTKLLHM